MNKLRSDLNVGFPLLFGAGLLLSLAVKPIESALHGLAGESTGLGMAPSELAAFKVAAVILLGPLVLGALMYILRNGLDRTLAQIMSSWWTGFKTGVVCLLAVLPFFFVRILLNQVKSNTTRHEGEDRQRSIRAERQCKGFGAGRAALKAENAGRRRRDGDGIEPQVPRDSIMPAAPRSARPACCPRSRGRRPSRSRGPACGRSCAARAGGRRPLRSGPAAWAPVYRHRWSGRIVKIVWRRARGRETAPRQTASATATASRRSTATNRSALLEMSQSCIGVFRLSRG